MGQIKVTILGGIMYNYKAKVVRVVDGDTYDMEVDLGFGIRFQARFRLRDVDTPETWRPKSDAEREHGERATARVKELIEGKEVTIYSHKLGIYGRYSADVYLTGGINLADLLREEGLEKLDTYA